MNESCTRQNKSNIVSTRSFLLKVGSQRLKLLGIGRVRDLRDVVEYFVVLDRSKFVLRNLYSRDCLQNLASQSFNRMKRHARNDIGVQDKSCDEILLRTFARHDAARRRKAETPYGRKS